MKQFGRQYKLTLGNEYESIVINNLRIRFEIIKSLSSAPNPATIHIYNLNESHRNAIASKQFNKAILSVGYENIRDIYMGDIIEPRTIREDLDFITEVLCGDGWTAYTRSVISNTLRAGATDADILKAAQSTMLGIDSGVVELPKDRVLPRSKVMMGNSRDVLTKIAKNNNADWSVQDGRLIILPKDKVLADNEGFVISQSTGMIGTPEKTDDGLKVTCSLNPAMRIGGLVSIESIINEYSGGYKIAELTHSGDVMESTWHTTITCVGGQYRMVKIE